MSAAITIAMPRMVPNQLLAEAHAKYPESLARAGAEMRWIELDDPEKAVQDALACDGLLLPGGGDIDPKFYGQERIPACGEPNVLRDTAEPLLLRAFLAADKPVLAICRGIQLMNVALGGDLYQDIKPFEHVPHNDHWGKIHTVTVRRDTLLSRILGQDTVLVNSQHHQAVDKVAPGLVLSALSEDGIVEGIEKPDAKFCLGVQWHPEWLSAADPAMQGIVFLIKRTGGSAMKSSKKRSRAVVTVVACILAVCLVAALVLFSLVNSKVRALQKGATFELSYNITAQDSASTPALYNILKQVGATSGDVAGLYSPGQLQLYLYPSGGLARAETGGTDFFTDLYIDANDTYFDAGRLYRTLRDSIADSAPLVGAFLPEWSLPNYITQAQLAKILGVPNTQVAMQEMSGYTLTLSRQCIVHPDYAKKDYTYYQFPSEGEDAAVLVVGLPLKSLLFDDTIPVDVHVEIPTHGVNAALSGTLKAGVNSLSAPVSVISDSDIDSIVQLRERLEQFADLINTALKRVQ